jgi:hypothetical protein
MLDVAGIIFSSMMMLIVIVRAVRLDNLKPWFAPIKSSEQLITATKQGWRRKS